MLRRSIRRRLFTALAGISTVAGAVGVAGPAPIAAALDDQDWLGIVNAYRAMSGLAPVTAEPAWAAGAAAHSCYMIQNDIAHDEVPGRPGYTVEGDLAGNNGNVAVSGSATTTARSHIELWMTGPFHAIGILRPNLTRTAYGDCRDATSSRWRSAATLDVLRGLDGTIPRPSTPVVFPGNGATVGLNRFIVESPDPLAMCGWAGQAAGLPLLAMMPSSVSTGQAWMNGPNGPIETCLLHPGNTSGTAQQLLSYDNALVVMPRAVLADGTYAVRVESDGGVAEWSFTVKQGAPLGGSPDPAPTPTAPTPVTEPSGDRVRFEPSEPYRLVDTRSGLGGHTRLRAGRTVRIRIGGPEVAAVSANFVATHPDAHGFLTAYPCTEDRPEVSLLNYEPGQTIANQSVVPLSKGVMCLYSSAATDVVIDVNGTFGAGDGAGFVPIPAKRLYQSDRDGTRLRPGRELRLTVTGAGVPGGAAAVALNVTAVLPSDHGFIKVYPCGSPAADQISTVNYAPASVRPNSVVTPLDDRGRICLTSHATTDVIVDLTGYFAADGLDFQPLLPMRVFDSRQRGALNRLTAAQPAGARAVLRIPVAGVRGVPGDARAVSVNVTATQSEGATHLTAFACDRQPATSNVNLLPGQLAAANGTFVPLSDDGAICVFTYNPSHVIVDINGVWM